jgi:peroxiredoxin
MSRLMPRQKVPDLKLRTLDGSGYHLAAATPERFSMIVFYRGLHCAVCNTYLRELDRLHSEFANRGIETIAVSSDSRDRAEQTKDKWRIENLRVAYELEIPTAREWGLYVSASRGKATNGIEEPAVFSEPGVFVVRPDQTLYWCSISTMPFARPHFSEMLQAFDMVHKINYPARGEL